MLFDDDSVDTIKESDIPNYFGDSPKGSAYVLYYQAVDLDMAALGLRQPAPPAPPTPASTAATSSAPDKLSTLSGLELSKQESESPALPPGLAGEPDPADLDGSPHPTSQFSPKLTPLQAPPPGPPTLVVSIPPTVQQASPPTPSGGGGGSNALSGLKNALRSTTRRPAQNGSGSESRKSLLDPVLPGSPLSSPASPSLSTPRRPPTARSTASTADNSHHSDHAQETSPPTSSSPSAWHATSNGTGKERLPEKKSSVWFKIRSSRAEASFSAPSSGSPTIPSERAATVKEKSSRKHRSTQVTKDGKLFDSSSPSSRSSRPPTAPSASSTASADAAFRKGSSSSPSPPPIRLHTEHKKSLPEFALARKSERRSNSTSRDAALPPRPSTAGATVGSVFRHQSPSPIPPVPSLPAAPTAVLNGELLTAEPEELKGKERDDTGSVSAEASHEGETQQHHRGRSGTVPVPVGLGFTASEGTTSSLSTSDHPVQTSSKDSKRATRKLSLTASMFALGRRDKDRHKDKDKDKDKDK